MPTTRTYQDIDERLQEFNYNLSAEYFRAEINRKRACQKAAKELGEQVLTPPQINTLAYILGYSRYLSPFAEVASEFRLIERRIPPESCVDLTKITHLRSYGGLGFRRSGIQAAFEQLGKEGKLHYTPERFDYAVSQLLE
ncbi:MAG: hypothetical protein HYW22_02140 [Candidatus Aenigmarchaeota archaeon]|nr:hypothetical protein [Candidatus Aenigmarchaeota archaeon]